MKYILLTTLLLNTTISTYSQNTFEGIIVFEITTVKYPDEYEKASKVKRYDSLFIKGNKIKQVTFNDGLYDFSRGVDYYDFDSLHYYTYLTIYWKHGYNKSKIEVYNPNDFEISDEFILNQVISDSMKVYKSVNKNTGGLIEVKTTNKIRAPHIYTRGLDGFPVVYKLRYGQFDTQINLVFLKEVEISNDVFTRPIGIPYVEPKDYSNFYFDFEN